MPERSVPSWPRATPPKPMSDAKAKRMRRLLQGEWDHMKADRRYEPGTLSTRDGMALFGLLDGKDARIEELETAIRVAIGLYMLGSRARMGNVLRDALGETD